MNLTRALAETVRAGDLVSTPRGLLLRVTNVDVAGDEVVIAHERGTLAPLRRGERVVVERRAGARARATEREGAAVRPPAAAPSPPPPAPASPISHMRVSVLAGVLAGFRWPGEGRPRDGTRRARAAEQVARFALESLEVVE
jgi:hypothetical protein